MVYLWLLMVFFTYCCENGGIDALLVGMDCNKVNVLHVML